MRPRLIVPLFLLVTASLLISPVSTSQGLQSRVPTPESVLGQAVGSDFFLATYDESLD